MHIFLETERLVLRRFTTGDVDNLAGLDADPDVMRFVSGGIPTSREEIENEFLPAFLGTVTAVTNSGREDRTCRAIAADLA